MNARVLDLVKKPFPITPIDLDLLKTEITKYPYMQSLRAVYLYGLQQLEHADYSQNLAITAAFTTDKKILYRLINPATPTINTELPIVNQPALTEELPKVDSLQTTMPKTEAEHETANCILEKSIEPSEEMQTKPTEVVVDEDELVEEKIVESKEEIIEHLAESVYDKGDSVILESENPVEKQPIETGVSIENVSPISEVSVLNSENSEEQNKDNSETKDLQLEDKIEEKTAFIESVETNFHGVEDFLPHISVSSQPNSSFSPHSITTEKEKWHQDEMQKLIAEVEAKMKAKKENQTDSGFFVPVLEEENTNNEINFSEVHEEVFVNTVISELQVEEESQSENLPESHSTWQPMNTLIEVKDNRFEKENIESSLLEDSTEFNKKQFNSENSISAPLYSENTSLEHPENQSISAEMPHDASNIPQFINTWHSWLKLDKEENTATVLLDVLKKDEEKLNEATEPKIIINDEILGQDDQLVETVKNQAIESFIENEPKISRLKESSEYTHKDRGDDISHLMTETLVQLYIEQKLYTKAIVGYEILIEKNPEKTEHYRLGIESVKNLRANPKG